MAWKARHTPHTRRERKLTPAQAKALLAIDGAKPEPGTETVLWTKAMGRYTTLHALEDLGLVQFRCVHSEHSDLRRGAYGRWIGGTVRWTSSTFLVMLTADGHEAVFQLRNGRNV